MLNFFKSRFAVFGSLPLCNLNEKRSFFVGSFCFPLCVRCTAIIFVFILTVVLKTIAKGCYKKTWIFLWITCIIPCLIDGVLQYFFKIESTNLKRFIFGGLCGYGIGSLLVFFIQFLDYYLFKK